MAVCRLAGSALPCPAMSNAVPWSGLVRTKGRPSVMLTPWSRPRYLTGIRPWSWYCATTTSKRPWRACMKTVSPGQGPLASMPSSRAASMAGRMMRASSSPNSPPSPACGFRPATATRGAATPSARPPWCASRMADICASKSARSMAWRSEQWMVTSTVAMTSLASIMATRRAAAVGQDLGVPGIGHAGGGQRLLVDGRGHHAGHAPVAGQVDGVADGLIGGLAAGRIDPPQRRRRRHLGRRQQADGVRLEGRGGHGLAHVPHHAQAIGGAQRIERARHHGGIAHHHAAPRVVGLQQGLGDDLRPMPEGSPMVTAMGSAEADIEGSRRKGTVIDRAGARRRRAVCRGRRSRPPSSRAAASGRGRPGR